MRVSRRLRRLAVALGFRVLRWEEAAMEERRGVGTMEGVRSFGPGLCFGFYIRDLTLVNSIGSNN